ncbi:hypothetical protein KKF04_06465, partial [Patescibacteria group bacterium]|nr:hypothetical protein [Patescibacteria group bacterium]
MKKGSELNSSASQELDQGSKESLMAGVRDCIGSVIGFLEEFHEDQRGSVEINRHRIMGILGILTVVCMFGGGVCKPENPYAAADALIQVKGLNSGHIAKLNEMGITLPKSAINNIFVDELFPEGVKGYPHFKRTVMDALQPKEIACADTGAFECGRTRAENTAAILSYCALGRHQILLSYHGHYIKGWEDADWNRRLILIHRFMASPRMQNTVFVGILGELKDKYDGDPKQMASAYYSGS